MKVKEQVELFIAEQGILPLNPSKDAKKAATRASKRTHQQQKTD